MGNQGLEKRNQHQNTSIAISDKRVKAISRKLTEVNMLVAFKMEGSEIIAWASELNRLLPNEELKKIPFILDCFKTETLVYDKSIGIQNFFRAVKIVYEENGEFKIRKAIW